MEWGNPKWLVYWKIPSFEMDDDCGYFRKPPYDDLWIFMDYLWIIVDCLWIIYGLFIVFCGLLWIIYGLLLIIMDLYEFLWITMD